jgi:glycosyltransferase involved in cell wall biosynthesis
MRFLIVSYAFLPSLGGQETASLMLAEELARRGHQVDLVTATPDGDKPALPFAVHHRPWPVKLLALHGAADVVIHNGFSLRFAWPMLVRPRPWLAVHQTYLPRRFLHRLAVRRARNVAISRAVAASLPGRSVLVPNAYRAALFGCTNHGARDYDIAFAGRLVSDKGGLLLLQALVLLQERGRRLRTLVIGHGEEEQALRDFAAAHGLAVDFAGPRFGAALAGLLNRARLLVVPSLWAEPFGIVALEGIACGCVAIGSAGGGLPEAIGPCGLTFPNGDATALADAIAKLLDDPARLQHYRQAAPAHLARHTPQAIVDRYLDVLGMG